MIKVVGATLIYGALSAGIHDGVNSPLGPGTVCCI